MARHRSPRPDRVEADLVALPVEDDPRWDVSVSERRVRRSWLVVALAAILTVAIATAVATRVVPHGRAHPSQPQVLPPLGDDPRPQTIRLARGLVKVPASWELVVRGPALWRVDLRAGVVVRTVLPILQSTGPTYLVVGADRVFLAPLDFVPGVVVVDGQPARAVTGLLAGAAFPGPDDRYLWAGERTGDESQPARMELVDLDLRPVGPSVAGTAFPASGDGTGKLVYTTATGTYLESPTGRSLITTATLLAISATRWLTIEHRGQGCELVTTDRTTGARRALRAVDCLKDDTYFPGVVSPDGTTAAAVEGFATGSEVLHLIDLASGADHVVGVPPIYADGSTGHLVWSPDSRSLWFVARDGEVDIVDRDGSHLRRLQLELPPVAQLAFRVMAGR